MRSRVTLGQRVLVASDKNDGSRPTKRGTPAATPAEMRVRRDFIRNSLLQGMTYSQVREECRRTFGGLTDQQVKNAYDQVLEAWSSEEEADSKHTRAAVIQRLRADLAVMRAPLAPSKKSGRRLTPKKKLPWKEINAHETLLAKVEGTLRPTEVKVDVDVTTRRSLMAIVGTMTGPQLDALLEEERRLEEAARGGTVIESPVQQEPVPKK